MECHIYRSDRRPNCYLYLLDKDAVKNLPQALLQLFGVPQYSFSFDLENDRKLAVAKPAEVIEKLESEGYYLQIDDDSKDPLDAYFKDYTPEAKNRG